ncbi:MAG: histidinol dehydrogenase [Bacillota bacterium]|nr:histidinol dehydrogenase [Bacillota bacterium]
MIPTLSVEDLLARRHCGLDLHISAARRIVNEVRERGDGALVQLTRELDHVALDPGQLRVTPEAVQQAYAAVDTEFVEAVRHAKRNVWAFHETQVPRPSIAVLDGYAVGRASTPIERAGLYVPGGTAAYPSTVVMTAVPAKVAGVSEVIMCTPPGPSGEVNPFTLVAADVCGVDKVFRVGGAQAIAAMAYGTETIPAVDMIVGPGNSFVTAAKKLVFGDVGIDMLAGPSEILIIADESAVPEFVAADLLSQAEHDVLASAVLLTTSADLAEEVVEEIERQLSLLPRRDIIARSLRGSGAIVLVQSLDQAVDVANAYAPEHIEIMTRRPLDIGKRIKNAGAVFLGTYSPEPVGDYIAGPNHVLPTQGSARYRGSLGVQDFLKSINVIQYDESALREVAEHAIVLARTEGLMAHANSIEVRLAHLSGSKETAGGQRRENPLVKLDRNENPWELPDSVRQDIIESLARLPFNRYPSPDADELRSQLAQFLGVREDMVVVGAGSDELIQIVMLAFRERARRVVTARPTFCMYRRIADVVGIPVKEIPLREEFSLDAEAVSEELLREDTLAFLCNPNNPTGSVYTRELARMIQTARGIVVVDEAYHEFCGETFLHDVSGHVLILRTLSKAFGLAGLRVGYAVAHPSVSKQLSRAKLPFNCSAVSILVAQKVLEHHDDVRRVVDMITRERDRLYQRLTGLGVKACPSHANFILFRPPRPAKETHGALLDMGIAVRRFDGLPEYLRVTVGRPEENDAFIEAMARLI